MDEEIESLRESQEEAQRITRRMVAKALEDDNQSILATGQGGGGGSPFGHLQPYQQAYGLQPDGKYRTATTGQRFITAQQRLNMAEIAAEKAHGRTVFCLWALLVGSFLIGMGAIGWAANHVPYHLDECYTVNKGEILCTIQTPAQ